MNSILNKKKLKLIFSILLFIYIILLFVNPVITNEETDQDKPKAIKKEIKELQIGIKKKVANCERKSKSNDVLHIHYEVSLKKGQLTSIIDLNLINLFFV